MPDLRGHLQPKIFNLLWGLIIVRIIKYIRANKRVQPISRTGVENLFWRGCYLEKLCQITTHIINLTFVEQRNMLNPFIFIAHTGLPRPAHRFQPGSTPPVTRKRWLIDSR